MRLLLRLQGHLHELAKQLRPGWRAAEKKHLELEPTCRACDGTEKLQVHHVKPWHLFILLRLVQRNLVTLCMGPNECHFRIGHGSNWKAWNPDVETDAALVLERPELRPQVEQAAVQKRMGA